MDDTFDIKIGKTNISSANHTQTKRNDGVNFIFGNKNNSNTDLEELYAEYEEAEANYNDALQSQQKQDTEAQNQINNSETQKAAVGRLF